MKLNLGDRTYPILIGSRILVKLAREIKKKKLAKVFILSDRHLKLARNKLKKALSEASIDYHEIPVTAGESLKEFKSVYPIYGELIKGNANRHSLLIALGGGTIGDVGGFIASSYLRGIPWIGVPTTLLSQVDSSVGGKTGINHALGKNLIGSFYQPSLVICDTQFLSTLSSREIASGIGEIAKCAIACDLGFFKYLEKNLELILNRNQNATQYSIKKALYHKCDRVEKDEFDRTGIREVLNFGHTFGHALESLTHYKTFQHGEAVVWGMRFAISLSKGKGLLNPAQAERVNSLLKRIPVPQLPKKIDSKSLFRIMQFDKKMQEGKIRFVLIKSIGQSISDRSINQNDLERAFAELHK